MSSGIPAASGQAERDEQRHAGEQHAERLGDRQAERGLLEHLAAERDLESGVAAGFARCEHGVDRLVGDLRDGSVELDLDYAERSSRETWSPAYSSNGPSTLAAPSTSSSSDSIASIASR